MGFKGARENLIQALEGGNIQFPYRAGELEAKNFLAVGKVTAAEVVGMLKACRGYEYTESKLHENESLVVHVFKPNYENERWYIKAYLIESVGYVMSVHPSSE